MTYKKHTNIYGSRFIVKRDNGSFPWCSVMDNGKDIHPINAREHRHGSYGLIGAKYSHAAVYAALRGLRLGLSPTAMHNRISPYWVAFRNAGGVICR